EWTLASGPRCSVPLPVPAPAGRSPGRPGSSWRIGQEQASHLDQLTLACPGDSAVPASGRPAGPGWAAPGMNGQPGRAGPGRVVSVLAGLREPIVVILLLIALFTSISGKPLDGLLMLVAGVGLAWDAGRRSRRGGPLSDGGRPESRATGQGVAEKGVPGQ